MHLLVGDSPSEPLSTALLLGSPSLALSTALLLGPPSLALSTVLLLGSPSLALSIVLLYGSFMSLQLLAPASAASAVLSPEAPRHDPEGIFMEFQLKKGEETIQNESKMGLVRGSCPHPSFALVPAGHFEPLTGANVKPQNARAKQ